MKSKSLFCAVLLVVVFSQISLPVFAADRNQKLFDKAWDNALNSKRNTTSCIVSVPSEKINKKLASKLSLEEKKMATLEVDALKRHRGNISGFFSAADHIWYFWSRTMDTLAVPGLYTDQTSTFSEIHSFLSGALPRFNMDVIVGYGDKVYYRLDGGWKVFEDHDYATKEYEYTAKNSIVNFVDKDTLVFAKNIRGDAVYNGKASASITDALLSSFIGEDLAAVAKPAGAQLFINSKGEWKKVIVETSFNYHNVEASVREVCSFDYAAKKVPEPSGATSVDKDIGKKELNLL